MEINGNEKVGKKFYCKYCDYLARDKSNYNKHLQTQKHFGNKMEINGNNQNPQLFTCECNKIFKTKSGLWKHKTTSKLPCSINTELCKYISTDNDVNNINMLDIVKTLIVQQNNMLEKITEKQTEHHEKVLQELLPKIGNTTNNNNNNNNQFNINMFLNEKCKDAINIKEFIDMIVFNKDTMDDSKNLGIEKTMTNLIIDKLNSLDIHKRPIHCSDIRRETIYVKDNGEWTKTNTKTILKKMIRSIQDKGCTTLSEWRKQNPDDPKGNPDLLDPNALYYHKVIKQICLETEKYDDKVIRNICKTTYVK